MNSIAEKVRAAEAGKTHLFSTGQAGFILKSRSGQLLGIDLYLSECVERLEGHMGFKRLLPRILEPEELALEGIIATHPHWDHFDMDAMPGLLKNGKTKLFASVDCRALVHDLGLSEDRISYVEPGQTKRLGDVTLHFINCDHGSGAPDAVGVVIELDGKRLFFAGDTCLRLDRTAEILQFGPIDVMLAPINGAYGNLNEAECARLAEAVKPKLTVPCHYGMFASHGGDPGLFYEIMKQRPERPMLLMAMGEAYTF